MDNFILYGAGHSGEVVDKFNKVVCVMPMGEIARQGLATRAAGLILRGRDGKMLFPQQDDGSFGLSAFGITPAGWAAWDYCRRLLKDIWGLDGQPRALGFMPPAPQTGNAFLSLFECVVSPAFAGELVRENILYVDYGELEALASRQGLISPLLALVLRQKLPLP